jgi:hypothetical protein
MSNNQPVIACNPSAIAPEARESHAATSKSIFSADVIIETKELPNGYAFRLPLETPMLYKTVEFIANERLCCPFFTFTLVIGEQFWLELTGIPEVKELIKVDILQIVETGSFPTMESLQDTYDAATHD